MSQKPEGKHYPPRASISRSRLDGVEQVATFMHDRACFIPGDCIEYLSRSESDALVKEAVAKAFEGASKYCAEIREESISGAASCTVADSPFKAAYLGGANTAGGLAIEFMKKAQEARKA